MRSVAALSILALIGTVIGACSGGSAGRQLAQAPAFDPNGQAKCGVTKSQAKPLIVEWPSADRGELETRAKQGLVAVRYEGCEMEVLDRCEVPGSYAYTGMTRKADKITIRDSDDLYASIPIYAAKFEGKLQKSGELNVSMTMVGRYVADRPNVREDELQGDCSRATHVVTALTAGAFEFFAGADAEAGGAATVAGAGAGAKSTSSRETLNRDGEKAACEQATPEDKAPPAQCGALLRVEVAPLVRPPGAGASVSRFGDEITYSRVKSGHLDRFLAQGPSSCVRVEREFCVQTDPWQGRHGVMMIHPFSETEPGILELSAPIPDTESARLVLSLHADPRGDHVIDVVARDGQGTTAQLVPRRALTPADGWVDLSVPLAALRGRHATITLFDWATGWYYEGTFIQRFHVEPGGGAPSGAGR